MKIRHLFRLGVPLLMATIVLPGLVLGQEAAAQKETPVAAAEVAPALPAEPAAASAPLSPLMRDVEALWTSRQAEVAALGATFRATTDHAAALAIQRRIEALLVQTEIDLLQLQADHARDEGRVADAERIEAEIATAIALPQQKSLERVERSPRPDGERSGH